MAFLVISPSLGTFLMFSLVLGVGFVIRLLYAGRSKPPLAPGSLPLLGHTMLFLKDLTALASIVSNPENYARIIRFKLPFDELWLVRGSAQIRLILSDPRTFDFGPMKSLALERLLGLSAKVTNLATNDTTGVKCKPLPGNTDKRYNYMERNATNNFNSTSSHTAFVEQFEKNVYQWVEDCAIDQEWTTMPDFYQYIRDMTFQTTTDAFFGPHLLGQSPHLRNDFWKFDESVPLLAKGLPKLLTLKAVKVRDRCTEAFMKWREFALKKKTPPHMMPEWNEASGLRCMGLRNEVFEKFEEWDDKSCAASDFAVLFGLTSNIVRANFWFFLEILQSKDLFENTIKEISSTVKAPNLPLRFDQRKLLKLDLFQSIYAETLRMYVSVIMVRQARQKTKVGQWAIPCGQKVAVCNYSEHMNEEIWNPENSPDVAPVNKFWGRRFLKYPELEGGKKYESKGALKFCTNENWLPYGFGERMCPGRNFAKHQMLLTFAVFSSAFDIELFLDDTSRPKPDMKYFGYGVMPPDSILPFRIRRKAKPDI